MGSTRGGRGTCGKWKVQVQEGSCHLPPADQDHLSAADLKKGWRLSCQTEIRSEMVVGMPRLLSKPKTVMFGVGRQVLLDPHVHKIHLALKEPELDDQRSDVRRILRVR